MPRWGRDRYSHSGSRAWPLPTLWCIPLTSTPSSWRSSVARQRCATSSARCPSVNVRYQRRSLRRDHVGSIRETNGLRDLTPAARDGLHLRSGLGSVTSVTRSERTPGHEKAHMRLASFVAGQVCSPSVAIGSGSPCSSRSVIDADGPPAMCTPMCRSRHWTRKVRLCQCSGRTSACLITCDLRVRSGPSSTSTCCTLWGSGRR